ncbi:MAG: transporter, partial [Calditrichia bacterium]
LDIAAMMAFPVGKYNSEKLVNIGLNRWYGRIALPFKWHFGVFSPGYMSSFELTPAVWLFAENEEFIGHKLENDPLLSLEAHLTHDFTRNFFGSLDMLYQYGFQSKIDGSEVGEKLEIGNVGFAMNYQISDNITIRTSFSSNVFGDENLETSAIRLQFIYGWNQISQNMKKLMEGN